MKVKKKYVYEVLHQCAATALVKGRPVTLAESNHCQISRLVRPLVGNIDNDISDFFVLLREFGSPISLFVCFFFNLGSHNVSNPCIVTQKHRC